MKKFIGILIIIASCINPYEFEQELPEKYLVVDGFVSNQEGFSEIRVSYSKAVNSRIFENSPDALVKVIENDATEYPFIEKSPGLYVPADPLFRAYEGDNYKMQIIANNKVYESKEMQIQKSARIEDISFAIKNAYRTIDRTEYRAADLFVTTEEDLDASKYYRYSTEETWQIYSPESVDIKYIPNFLYDDNGVIVDVEWIVESQDNLTYCWANTNVRGINIASSEGLVRNQLVSVPVFTFSLENSKLRYKYSALIKQYSIPKEVYNFIFLMNKFSASDISLFDVIPGLVEGNIRCLSNPEEKVIGVFYATDIQEERIFITIDDLDPSDQWLILYHDMECGLDLIDIPHELGLPKTRALQFMRDSLMTKQGLVIADLEYADDYETVIFTKRICVDCTVAGTNIKPEFWGDIY